MSESRFYHISATGEFTGVLTLTAVLVAAKEGGFLWLDYYEPTKEELSTLITPLGLHPLSIEDCTDENQVPKIENFPRNTFILFNTFSYLDGVLTIGELDLIIGDNFLVTVSGRDLESRRLLSGIERSVELSQFYLN